MNRKLVGGTTAVLLAGGMILGAATTAQAHSGEVYGVAHCADDGTQYIDWTFNATNVPTGVEAEVKAMNTSQGVLAPIDGVLKGGQVFLSVWSDHQINVPGAPVKTGNWSAQYKTAGIPGDFKGDVTSMVQFDYKNADSGDPVGIVTVPGDCGTPPIEEPPVKEIKPIEFAGSAICVDKKATGTSLTFTNPNDFTVYYEAGVYDSANNGLYGSGAELAPGASDTWGSSAPDYAVEDATYTVVVEYSDKLDAPIKQLKKFTFTIDCAPATPPVEPPVEEPETPVTPPVDQPELPDVDEPEVQTPVTHVVDDKAALLVPVKAELAATGSDYNPTGIFGFAGTVVIGGVLFLVWSAVRRHKLENASSE